MAQNNTTTKPLNQNRMEKETLEEAAENLYPHNPFWIGSGENARLYDEFKTQRDSFIEGAKWMQEQLEKLKDFDTWKEWKNQTFKSE
jgi:hypothetical protein